MFFWRSLTLHVPVFRVSKTKSLHPGCGLSKSYQLCIILQWDLPIIFLWRSAMFSLQLTSALKWFTTVTLTLSALTHWDHSTVLVHLGILEMVHSARTVSNNFRRLNAVKEMKTVHFIRHNSGEKFHTAHAAKKLFRSLSCRFCATVVNSWFSHRMESSPVLTLRIFQKVEGPFFTLCAWSKNEVFKWRKSEIELF